MNTPSLHWIETVLDAWGKSGAIIQSIDTGNINTTYRVTHTDQSHILQRLNPIFAPQVHDDIEAVTEHLKRRGIETPRLCRTHDGRLWTLDSDGGVWRMMTFVEGDIHSAKATPAMCREAGTLLGRFHAALVDLEHDFCCRRPGVHDTARHCANLTEALERYRDHPTYAEVEPLARSVLGALADLPALGELPVRIVHGDPKLNNIVFSPAGKALCFIDLDTVGRMSIPVELGDAFRSWCNFAGEDQAEATFDLDCFAAGLLGYTQSAEHILTPAERQVIPLAIETITLELASRFCFDTLEESYFAWDREKFARASEHNLQRARTQLSLAHTIAGLRKDLERITREVLADS